MIMILAALASTVSMSDYRAELSSREYQFAAGDTRRIDVSADVYNHPSIKPKKKKIALRIIPELKPTPAVHNGKNVIAFIPKDNGLAQIIARVKRENGLTTKVKS